MPEIQSRIIIGPKALPETMLALAKQYETTAEPGFCVFETSVGHKTVHCCWAGGVIDHTTGHPSLTLVGTGAMEAMLTLPYNKKNLIFAELRLGKKPLQEKVKKIILDAPEDSYIVFVGDLEKELDGQMTLAFNPTGAPIILEN